MPRVTIVIPALNEEKFIGTCLDSLLDQDIGLNNIEIMVVDGGSHDKTQQIVQTYAEKYPNVKLLENPKKFTVFAFNIGIRNSHSGSEFITFLNCHAEYSKDRLRKSIDYIYEYKAEAVGGRSEAVSRSETLLGRSIALSIRSIFSTGSKFRVHSNKITFADTASGCLYRKSIFKKIGLFNEHLIYSQDIELSKRVRLAGGKILYVPDMVTQYKARSQIFPFLKHTYRNGLWAILPFMYSNVLPMSIRHIVPGFLCFSVVLLTLATFLGFVPFLVVPVIIMLYLIANLIVSISISWRQNDPALIVSMFIVFLLFHGIYGIGSLVGIFKLLSQCIKKDNIRPPKNIKEV